MFFDFRGYQVAGKRMKKLPPRKKKNEFHGFHLWRLRAIWPDINSSSLRISCEHQGIRINGFDPYRHRYHIKYIQISCANRCEIHFQMVGACRFYKGIICTRRVPIDIPDLWICSQTLPWLLRTASGRPLMEAPTFPTLPSHLEDWSETLVGLSENNPPPV